MAADLCLKLLGYTMWIGLLIEASTNNRTNSSSDERARKGTLQIHSEFSDCRLDNEKLSLLFSALNFSNRSVQGNIIG